METSFWKSFLASSSVVVVTSSGIYVMLRFSEWAERNIAYFISFAMGLLVSAFVCVFGSLPMLGIGFHSFVDGFTYSIAFGKDYPGHGNNIKVAGAPIVLTID
ncbi:MAG: hypothetical protein ACP5U1_11125 [Desulfomonilaceae bacterium]